MKDLIAFASAIMIVVVIMIVGAIAGSFVSYKVVTLKAIESGVAHYVCDQTTGKCEFQFKGAE